MHTVLLTLLLANPTLSVQQGSALLDDWQLEEAKAIAEKTLAEAPTSAEAQVLAAEVLHQRGAHVQALSLLRAALGDDAPPRGHALRPLLEASASYAVDFAQVQTPHFAIRYLNKDEIVARYAAPVLEAAYANIGADLMFLPAERGEKIVVEIYPDARALAGATGLTMQEIATSGTIAVCKYHRLMITSPLATADGYGWADTVAHELTHLVISKKSHNNVPIWLHEGIAKFFESRWRGPAGQALGPYGESLLAQAVRRNSFISFAQMHPSMAKLPSQQDAALAFAEVFTVIEYITQQFGTQAVAKILAGAGDGLPLEAVLQKVLGMNLAGLEKAWKKSLSKRQFHEIPGLQAPSIRLRDGNQEETPKQRPLESMTDKRVHMAARLGELLQLRGQAPAAVIEYEKALAHGGAQYSTLVNRLAHAYADLGRLPDALKLLDDDLRRRPDNNDAHLLAGRICLKQQQWPLARQHFDAVRLQNPFNPEIHAALAVLAQKANDPETAEQEKRFLQLCEKPRPPQRDDPPPPPVGDAYVSVTSVPWGTVQIDGNTLQTPTWHHPVKAGSHTVVFSPPGGSVASQNVNVGHGGHAFAVFR